MSVTFFGVRGSTPCHGPEIARYGGNTSCVELDIPGLDPILFDLGTGLRYFGLTQSPGAPFSGTCLLSHLHWDHIQGLPFFTPLLRAGSHVAIYGPRQPNATIGEAFADTIRPPVFPVTLDQLPGDITFHDVHEDEWLLDAEAGVTVMSRPIPHVGHTLGYRVTWQGRSVVYMSDHQMPHDGTFAVTDGARELLTGADLVIHDAQYTPDEFEVKNTWGHCTIDFAVWLAQECGVKRLALFHHDPAHHDDELDKLTAEAVAAGADAGLEVFAAREATTITV